MVGKQKILLCFYSGDQIDEVVAASVIFDCVSSRPGIYEDSLFIPQSEEAIHGVRKQIQGSMVSVDVIYLDHEFWCQNSERLKTLVVESGGVPCRCGVIGHFTDSLSVPRSDGWRQSYSWVSKSESASLIAWRYAPVFLFDDQERSTELQHLPPLVSYTEDVVSGKHIFGDLSKIVALGAIADLRRSDGNPNINKWSIMLYFTDRLLLEGATIYHNLKLSSL